MRRVMQGVVEIEQPDGAAARIHAAPAGTP
jgi:hypothetical protein